MGKLADHRARLATAPLTRNQLGAIMGEWDRLGLYSRKYHRAERLRLTAMIAHYPGDLETTKDLTKGEAGRALAILLECKDLTDLIDPDDPPAGPPVTPWYESVSALAGALFEHINQESR